MTYTITTPIDNINTTGRGVSLSVLGFDYMTRMQSYHVQQKI